MVANVLVKYGISHDHDVVYLDCPLCYASRVYLDDLKSFACARRVPNIFVVLCSGLLTSM